MKKHLFCIIYTFILIFATVLSLLGTFVFAISYETQGVEGLEQEIPDYNKGEEVWTENSYEDNNISIHITTTREYDTTVYIADIQIKHLGYLQTALANNQFGRNIKEYPSKMAARNHAILAINGDYYGYRDKGLVIRNGYLFDETRLPRENSDLLIIDKNGEFEIIKEELVDIKEVHSAGAWQTFCFGPGLIIDNEIVVTRRSEVDAHKVSNPRTAIGYVAPLHYIMLVSDGRMDDEKGLSLLELANVLKKYGCQDAYNLDGGGSSVMIFNNKILNKPTFDGVVIKERRSSDIVYIGY